MSAIAIAYLRDAILQTLGIACAALAIAILLGAPLALVIIRGGIAGRTVAACVAVIRAIPDLVLAVIAVVAIGLGPAAGVVALGLHYTAVVAKVYAEILGAVRRDAAEALRATGATASAAFLVGMLPAAWPGIVGFGAYVFESVVRASVIVGVVGAGGMGALLVQQLNLADFQGFGLTVFVLVILVVVVDIVSERLRLHARPQIVFASFGGIIVCGIVAFSFTADAPWETVLHAPRHVFAFFVRAFPPDFSLPIVRTAIAGVVQSAGVAIIGTLAGIVLAFPLAWIASSAARARATLRHEHGADRIAAFVGRAALAVLRAIPVIALGLIGLTIVGIGPPAGIFALTLHTAGVLGKLLAESLELGERDPAIALAATGAPAVVATFVGLIPPAMAAMAAHALYRFEWNVRASTVLGMIGAGGLGQAIFNAQQLLFYRQLAAYVIVAILLVLAIDVGVRGLRERWHLRTIAA